MKDNILYTDWGLIDYQEAWEKQKMLFEELIADKTSTEKSEKTNRVPQRFIVCQHPHVYTLGRSGKAHNMLVNNDFLQKINATYYKIDRGGDITYHGPGQIVGYPILDLEQLTLSVKDYVHCIEGAIIRTLSDYQIAATRVDGATGVWLDANGKNPRKICAIGVRVSRYVTMHGFALNVNTDLSYFSYINPCGFVDKQTTSMAKEMQKTVDIEEVKQRIFGHFIHILPN